MRIAFPPLFYLDCGEIIRNEVDVNRIRLSDVASPFYREFESLYAGSV